MCDPKSSLRVCILAIVGLFCPALAPAPVDAQALLDGFPKTGLEDVPERYREWVTEEVGYLITEEEYEVFLRLGSPEKYERFIERFWEVRDPTPGTPDNEYKELHYERLAYANKFYGRGTSREGWETDRGRFYIMLGEPEMITRVPSEMLIHPVEVWFYAANPELGIPPFFYLMFYQEFSAGEFELYSPLSDGPKELLNGAGMREIDQRAQQGQFSQRTYSPTGFDADAGLIRSILMEIDYDVASAAFSYLPSEAGMEFGITPLSSEMLIADVENVNEKLMPDATWAYNVLTGVTDSDVRFETLELSATAVPLIDIDGEPFLHFAAKTLGEELNVGEFEEDYYFSFKAAGSIVDSDSTVLRNFEATMSGELDDEQARRFTSNPFVYMDVVPTIPGRQQFSLMLENTVAHSFGRGSVELDVPRARPERLQILGPLLALDVRSQEHDPFAGRFPFQYRDLVMVPSVDRVFDAGRPVYAFEQILVPEDFERPITARYRLANAAGITLREDRVVLSAEEQDSHGVIAQLWEIPTEGLEPGEYVLDLSIDERGGASVTETLRIRPAPEEAGRPFINPQPAPPVADVEVALERARLYRVTGDFPKAIEWLEFARSREPEDPEIRDRYVGLLDEMGRYETLVDVLTPVAAAEPRNTEILLKLARAHARTGEHYDAIRYYERARIVLGQDSPEILNPLAAEYHAEGRVEKAREILSLSLEIDADQPEIRRMLDRISTTDETSRP